MSLEFETTIESYDVHPNNNARISAIFKLFQKVAWDDINSAGLTYDMLRQRNIALLNCNPRSRICKTKCDFCN